MNRWWIGLFFLSSIARATTPNCLVAFGTLPADIENPAPLISATYRDLMDQLGAKLSPETLRKMAEAKDPFAVPEEPGLDTLNMNRKLEEFRKLLEQKGWNTPATRDVLAGDLRTRVGSRGEAQARVEQTVAESFSDHMIKFPSPSAIAASPDGRYVLGLAYIQRNRAGGYFVYDAVTRTVSTFSTPVLQGSELRFSPDGKRLYIASGKLRLFAYTFADGKVTPASEVAMGKVDSPNSNRWLSYLYFGTKPDRFVAIDDTIRPKAYLFNPVTLDRTYISLSKYLRGEPMIPGHGIVPGTDELFLLVATKNGRELHRVTVNDKGVLTRVSKREWSGFDAEMATYLPDGKTMVLATQIGAGILREGDAAPTVTYTNKDATIRQIVVHPDGKHAVLLERNGKTNWAQWLDLGTGTVTDGFDIGIPNERGKMQIVFSGDGKTMYVNDQEPNWYAINYRERLKPETLAK